MAKSKRNRKRIQDVLYQEQDKEKWGRNHARARNEGRSTAGA